MPVLNTTDKNFKNDVLDSSKPVLVDFWAEWCGPCKAIAPALDEISNEMSDNITVAKINIDENPNTCLLYTSPSPRDGHQSRMPSSA